MSNALVTISDWLKDPNNESCKFMIQVLIAPIIVGMILGIWNAIIKIRPNSAIANHEDPKNRTKHYLYYSQLKMKAVGYDDKFKKLDDFLKLGNPFKWCLIIGEGGTGKSKLCYDFMRSKERKWWKPWGWQPCMPVKTDKGFTKETLDACIERLPRKTLFILDYAEYNTKEINNWMSSLSLGRNKKRKIRVILIQRRKSPSQAFDNLCHEGYQFPKSNDPISLNDSLSDNSMRELIGKYIKKYKKSVSETSNEIYEKLVRFGRKKKTYLRPLYALMLVDALSEKKPISYAKDILEHTYYRIQRTIKDSLADDGFGVSDNGYSNEQKTALILNVIATMIGTVSVDATCTALGITLPIQQASSDKRFSGISIFNNENCEPIEPDIIGTYFVLKCIEDNILENPSQYISYAWRLDENHYMRGFMKRLLQEWETSESAFKHFNLDTFSTVEIRDGETEVATQAFMSHTYIKKIIIPASITHIKFEAFTGCGNLEEVVFAESSQLESIGTAAFYGCVRLITINLPSALTTIGSHAFEKCPLGDSVIVPASINNAGKFAFFGCRVTFPDGFDEAFETRLLGGETLEFGGLIWDVVDERSYKGRIQKLIITHEVIEKRAYDAVTEDFWYSDDYTGTDWHNCSLRAYLNSTVHEYKQPDGTKSKFDFSTNGFLSRFTDEQLRQICPLEENGVPFTANENSSEGYVAANETQVAPVPGKETIDKVFLLSTKEVKKYYQPIEISAANYLKWCHGNGFDVGAPDEEFLTGEFSGWFPAAFPMSEDLIACDGKETAWWWLRSPGYSSDNAAYVDSDGYVSVSGYNAFRESGGVRPALWLNL